LKIRIFIVLFLAIGLVQAQPIHTLPVFTIKEKSEEILPSDTSNLNLLSDKAAKLPGISFRSYGPGSLQTLSYRGGGASQLLTTWEGIPINSSMNGQTDLSALNGSGLTPTITTSGSGFSGGLSGVLNLSDKVLYNSISLNYGSIGEYSASLRLRKNLGKSIWTSSHISGSLNPNQFTYQNPWNAETPRRENAAWQSFSFLQTLHFESLAYSFESKYWGQYVFRQLPGSLITGYQSDWQQDITHKWLNSLSHNLRGISLHHKLLLGDDRLDFYQGQLGSVSPSNSQYVRINSKAEKRISSIINAKMEVSGTSDWAQNDQYDGWKGRHIYSIQPEIAIKATKNFQIILKNRTDISRKLWNPKAEIAYELANNKFSVRYQGEVRYPTLNELFWKLGGNPSLAPEKAKKWELDYGFSKNQFGLSAKAFHYQTDNYILWYPSDAGYWQAQALGRVIQQGGEVVTAIDGSKNLGYGMPRLSLKLSYTESFLSNSNSFQKENQQLIFIPKWQYGVQAAWKLHWQLDVNLAWDWTDRRTTSFSGDASQPAFGLLSAGFTKHFTLAKRNCELGLSGQNLLNKTYCTIPYYPMPSRNVRVALQIVL